jgi:hypothetical protein
LSACDHRRPGFGLKTGHLGACDRKRPIYSFELGFAKPDAGYFKTIMKRIDVAPDRVPFIDEVRYGIHL